MGQNIGVLVLDIGGAQSALNILAAKVIKAAPGNIYRVIPTFTTAPTGGALVLSDANGLVTAQTITAISQAAAGVAILSTGGASNPFAVGQTITFASIVGMTQLNGLVGTVIAIGGISGAWTVTFNINTLGFTAYASGGSASSFGPSNQIISVPFGVLATGVPTVIDWPCNNGILVSAVPTGGTGVLFSVSFT